MGQIAGSRRIMGSGQIAGSGADSGQRGRQQAAGR